jgi:Rieske Fe-S protein
MLSWKLILPVFFFVGLLGFVTVALATNSPAVAGSATPPDLRVVKLQPDVWAKAASEPQCMAEQHFCLVETAPGVYAALYTYETHPVFRHKGCEVKLEATRTYIDLPTQEMKTGAFRDGCSGSTYDVTGRRVYGPAPHNLDQFVIRLVTDPATQQTRLEVDTGRLVCMPISSGDPCLRGPMDKRRAV